MYRLGVYEKSMPDINWQEKLSAAKNAGFDYLEISIDESDKKLSRLDWNMEERKKLFLVCRDTGLYISTMCLSGHRKYPIGSGNAETERRGMEIMEKAIEFAYDTGIRIIQLAGYDVYYGEISDVHTRERFFVNLEKSVRMAASRGVILAMETMENDFLNTVKKGMYYVNKINSPYLKMYPDVGNITNATDDVLGDIECGRGSIAAVHLKETVPGVFRDRMFGDGRVDFKGITAALKAQGVGMYTAEFWHDGSEAYAARLKYAHDFLRSLL